jgi:hypothetical protein
MGSSLVAYVIHSERPASEGGPYKGKRVSLPGLNKAIGAGYGIFRQRLRGADGD